VIRILGWVAVVVVLVLGACGGPSFSITQQEARDAAWQALAPNTSSGDRANWQVIQVRQVKGREVMEEFAREPSLGCWKGPTPMPNAEIRPGNDYWYVEMSPVPTTPLAGPTLSPTAPPFVPEPFLRQALFLLDAGGQVVARKLYCIVY
jgi:hypothetical protein